MKLPVLAVLGYFICLPSFTEFGKLSKQSTTISENIAATKQRLEKAYSSSRYESIDATIYGVEKDVRQLQETSSKYDFGKLSKQSTTTSENIAATKQRLEKAHSSSRYESIDATIYGNAKDVTQLQETSSKYDFGKLSKQSTTTSENIAAAKKRLEKAYSANIAIKNESTDATTYGIAKDVRHWKETCSKYDLFLKILLPSFCFGLLFIIIVVIAVVFFIKRKKTIRKNTQNEIIRRVNNNDQIYHKKHALADKASGHAATNAVSGHVIEADTGDTADNYSKVSPHNTLTDHGKNNSDGDVNAGSIDLIQHDTETMNSDPRSDYVMLNKDLQNCKVDGYTFLDPGSVYVILNKDKNNEKEQDYTSLKSESVYTLLNKDGNNEKEQEYESLEPRLVYAMINRKSRNNNEHEYTTMDFPPEGRKKRRRRIPAKNKI